MKNLKKLSVIVLGVFAAQYCQAQSTSMGDPVSFKLKNGMTIIVAENKGTSKIYSSFVIDAEPVPEGNKAGVKEILSAMLNETVSAAVGVTFDEKGGNIASASVDYYISLSVLSAAVQHPALTQELFDKLKAKLVISVIQRDRYYPESMTENSLSKLTLDDVVAFYEAHVTPLRSYLTVAGNISPPAAKILVKRAFDDWEKIYLSSINK